MWLNCNKLSSLTNLRISSPHYDSLDFLKVYNSIVSEGKDLTNPQNVTQNC